MACWTNKSAIMRDLSKAQGRYVPGGVEQAVGANEKPPALNFVEETEEDFFKNCTAGGDFIAPDLGLIKEMLNMVKDEDLSSGDEESIEITKLNPNAAEFKPRPDTNHNSDIKCAKMKRKLNRNVALTSLLTSIANKSENIENTPLNNNKEIKLLKPEDFTELVVIKENSTICKIAQSLSPSVLEMDSVSKVEPLIVRNNSPKKGKKGPTLSPVVMFKKKSVLNNDPVNIKENSKKGPSLSPALMFKKRPVSSASINIDDKTSSSPSHHNKEYKPSVLANQYYQKYKEQAQLAEKRKEDIWTKAEKLMKEVEAKRAMNATSMSITSVINAESVTDSSTDAASITDTASLTDATGVPDPPSATESPSVVTAASATDIANATDIASAILEGSKLTIKEASKLDIVRLPQHRHLLTGDCVVCIVMKKNGITLRINEENI